MMMIMVMGMPVIMGVIVVMMRMIVVVIMMIMMIMVMMMAGFVVMAWSRGSFSGWFSDLNAILRATATAGSAHSNSFLFLKYRD